ncbi:hypothetical protein KTT_57900 [Tengunoibacter tsumagoiensis]|uniref:Uncharacterized protein n=1 Tax=Tengunoibacter tsumagoiensis TaxID=2014871 RepID=A0A402AAH7_9CHLR|nr:hypothetical protein KTT_57900 [Tengunoibacter tsumagoiensis]
METTDQSINEPWNKDPDADVLGEGKIPSLCCRVAWGDMGRTLNIFSNKNDGEYVT